ncbi:MAG: threonine synthase [Methanomassiliicoccus sp.]|nr:threonine synthase [Methanomassiliicoccus sp.]
MFRCTKCGTEFRDFRYTCARCDSALLLEDPPMSWDPKGAGMWRYRSMIPVTMSISLYEGSSPLIRRRDSEEEVYLKVEGDNPTGSFKDRGTSVVISDAYNRGFRTTTVASTGNMGASVAAYSAYANLSSKVFIPTGIPEEKVAQITAYGAELVPVEGGFAEAVRRARQEADSGAYLASTGLNPYFIEGLKSIAFELFEQMGVPDKIVVPTGTGGILTSIFKGFRELKALGVTDRLPQMIAVQSSEVAPIVDAWRNRTEPTPPPPMATTIASAILVKSPFNGLSAIEALNRSGGYGLTVTDHQIVQAVRDLGKEGIFAEPAAAAPLAALGQIDRRSDDRIVLVVTGSGLKDPMVALRKEL